MFLDVVLRYVLKIRFNICFKIFTFKNKIFYFVLGGRYLNFASSQNKLFFQMTPSITTARPVPTQITLPRGGGVDKHSIDYRYISPSDFQYEFGRCLIYFQYNVNRCAIEVRSMLDCIYFICK